MIDFIRWEKIDDFEERMDERFVKLREQIKEDVAK